MKRALVRSLPEQRVQVWSSPAPERLTPAETKAEDIWKMNNLSDKKKLEV